MITRQRARECDYKALSALCSGKDGDLNFADTGNGDVNARLVVDAPVALPEKVIVEQSRRVL